LEKKGKEITQRGLFYEGSSFSERKEEGKVERNVTPRRKAARKTTRERP